MIIKRGVFWGKPTIFGNTHIYHSDHPDFFHLHSEYSLYGSLGIIGALLEDVQAWKEPTKPSQKPLGEYLKWYIHIYIYIPHILCYTGYMREYLGNKLLVGTFPAGSLHFPFQTADSPQLLGMKASLFCCHDLQQNAGVLPWVSRRRMWSCVIGSQFGGARFPFPNH